MVYLQSPIEFLTKIESVPASKRKDILLSYIDSVHCESNISVRSQEFLYKKEERSNIIITVPGSSDKKYVIGAHYDIWPKSGGVNDNGAAIFILLQIVKDILDLSNNPITLDFVFFDLEEKRQIGANEYLKHENIENIIAMINLDMCGIGDYVIFNDTSNNPPALSTKLEQICGETKINYKKLPLMPHGDDIAFRNHDIQAISVAIVPLVVIPVVERLAYISSTKGISWKKITDSVKFMVDMIKGGVPVLETMHTKRDTVDTISIKSMETIYSLVKKFIIKLCRNNC